MSFSSGFQDGYNYYLSLVDQERKDKLAESSMKTDELRRQSYQSTIDVNQEQLRLARMTPGEISAIPEEERTFSQLELMSENKINELNLKKADLDLDTSMLANRQAQAALDNTLSTIEDENDKEAVLTIMNINKRLRSGKINPVVAASILEEPLMTLKDSGKFDFTKYTKKETMMGWQKISPKLESGDFESIARENSDVLTNIFSERLQLFQGKTFISGDGKKGIIENVSLNGTFDPIPNSTNVLVGGSFKVKFEGDEDTTEVFSYLPDNARFLNEIKEDRTSDDAKVISVADIVDKVAAEKEFIMNAINNPGVMDTFIEAMKGANNYSGSPEKIEKMKKTHFDLKKAGEKHIGSVESSALKARVEAQKNFGDAESAYLGVYYLNEPEVAQGFIEAVPGEFEGEISYQLIEGQSLDLMKDKMVEKYANPQRLYAQVSNAYAAYEELAEIEGRQPFYIYDGEPFRFDMEREEVDRILKNKIGDDFDNIKSKAAEAFESRYGAGSFENIKDDEYISYITAYLNSIGI